MSSGTRQINGYDHHREETYGGLVNSDGWLYSLLGRRRETATGRPGSRLIAVATGLLALLGFGLLIVSIAAQYRYVMAERHQSLASGIESAALDLGMMIFALLALGLARAGQPAKAERTLVVICAAGSALMNYAAANTGSPRSVLAYILPPVFLAAVADRVVVVVRRHVLGVRDGRSPWSASGKVALWSLRLVLAAPSTLSGGRRAILNATPLPGATAIAELPAADEAAAAGRHRPETPAAGASKRALLEAAYEALGVAGDPRYMDRSAISPVARELAAQVGCEWGSARAVLGRYLTGKEARP
ncbi:MAG TPA: hypothetical protein VMK13_13510 [Streptosporangiaceae bacterium]|nr:hypothetical protein [Streptosporangiaceae bacterium]